MALVSISVKDLAGKILWGPTQFDSTAAGKHLFNRVTKDLEKHFAAKFVFQTQVLDSEASLASQGVTADSCFTLVLPSEDEKAAAEYARSLDTLASNSFDDVHITDKDGVAAEDVMKDVLADLGYEAADVDKIPKDITTWLTAMVTNRKGIAVDDYDFDMDPSRWSKSSVSYRCMREAFPKGLLYLSKYGNNDNVIMHVVDIEGELSRIYADGKAPKGSVWFANAWDQIHEVANAYSSACWQQIKDDTARPEVTLDAAPVCVAPSLARFFEAFAATGKPPSYRYIRAQSSYGPNEACHWLEGTAPLPKKIIEARLEKTEGHEIGCAYRPFDMTICSVSDSIETLVGKWNAGHPDAAIQDGDEILEVNGKKGMKGWADRDNDEVKVLEVKFGRTLPQSTEEPAVKQARTS